MAAYTCASCGLVKQEITYCHNLNHYDGQSPTCTIPGWEAYDICSDCGYTSYTEIPAMGHHYESVVTAPTCTEQGFTAHICTICGDSYVDTYVDAMSHDMGEWFLYLMPTCTADGIERRDCSRCDHYETRPIEHTGHSYKAIVIAPTCTEKGFTAHTCTACGDSYKDTYVEALGHDMGEWIIVLEAACAADGSERRDCSYCDHYETKVIPAIGHDYESVVTAPTCTEQGYTTHTCVNCGDSYVDTYVETLGHDMGEWVTVTEATCTEAGSERRDCSRCDHYETRTIKAAGHSYASVVTVPTCTAQGYTTHTCTVCGDSYVDSYVDALGETFYVSFSVPSAYRFSASAMIFSVALTPQRLAPTARADRTVSRSRMPPEPLIRTASETLARISFRSSIVQPALP